MHQLDKLAAYAESMADSYLLAHANALIFHGLRSDDVCRRLNETQGAYAFNALIRTLVFDLIRHVWAFTLDRDRRAPSIANLWQELGKSDVRAGFRARFCDASVLEWWGAELPAAEVERYMEAGRADYARAAADAFDSGFQLLAAAIPELLESEIAIKFDKARKRGIAHLNMTNREQRAHCLFDVASLGLDLDDPYRFLMIIEPHLFRLTHLLTRSEYAIDEFKQSHRVQAEDFWSRLLGKGAVSQ